MKESLYIELCPESSNIEYRVTGDADIVETKVFSGRQYAEDVYEFHFKYQVPIKKVRLSLIQIEDLVNFMKIYKDLNPNWRSQDSKLIKAKEIK